MLAVPNAAAAAAWYAEALGATELWNLGSVVGLEVAGAPLFLGEPEGNGWATPGDVAKTTVYVAGANYGSQSAVWQVVRSSAIGRAPSTLVGVPTLGYHGQLVEVEAIALVD